MCSDEQVTVQENLLSCNAKEQLRPMHPIQTIF